MSSNNQQAVFRPIQLANYLGICRRSLYQLAETDPTFPPKIIFSKRHVGWRKESIDIWLANKEVGGKQ